MPSGMILSFLALLVLLICLTSRLRSLPILLYHFVDGEGGKKPLSVSSETFEHHVRYLLGHHYRIISAAECVNFLKGCGARSSRKMAVLTFDDGDRAFYTKVYPVLVKYRVPAAIFVITDWIGRPGYLRWEDLRAMSPELVTIGSHTVSHRYLPDLGEDEIRHELVESRRILTQELARPVPFMSYPVGGFGPRIQQWAKEAGYEAAFATNRGRNVGQRNLFALKRIKMTEKTTSALVLAAKLSGYYQLPSEILPRDTGE